MIWHLHKWQSTDRTEVVPDHIDHPQDMPYPATYTFWRCSVCGKEKSFYDSPVGLQRRTIVMGALALMGIAFIAVDERGGDAVTWMGWIGMALIFPWIGVAMMLLTLAFMLVCSGIGWALGPLFRQVGRLGRYFGPDAT